MPMTLLNSVAICQENNVPDRINTSEVNPYNHTNKGKNFTSL